MMERIAAARGVYRVSTGEIEIVSADARLVPVDAANDFDQFYMRSRESVGRALAVTLRDADLASDAVDEAMARAYQRWNHVAQLDNPGGWVYRVGLNYARSKVRRLLRKPPPTADHVDFAAADPDVEDAIGRLSIDHRAVVVCRLLLGWSEAETASALRIRPGTAKSRLHRATQQLQRELAHLRPDNRGTS